MKRREFLRGASLAALASSAQAPRVPHDRKTATPTVPPHAVFVHEPIGLTTTTLEAVPAVTKE